MQSQARSRTESKGARKGKPRKRKKREVPLAKLKDGWKQH